MAGLSNLQNYAVQDAASTAFMSGMNNGMHHSLSRLGSLAASGGIGAALQAGGSLIGGLIGQAFAKRNLRRQVNAQKELTEFNLQKEYELMLNEMRFKTMGMRNAGISTASMNGQFGGNAAVPTQSAGLPQGPQVQMNPTLGLELAMALNKNDAEVGVLQAQADALKADARMRNADASVTETYGHPTAAQNLSNMSVTEDEILSRIDLNKADLKKKPYELSALQHSIPLIDAQRYNNIMGGYSSVRNSDLEWEKLDPLTKVMVSQAYMNYQIGKNQGVQAEDTEETRPTRIGLNKAQIAYFNQTVKNLKQKYKLDGETIKLLAEQQQLIKSLKNESVQRVKLMEFQKTVREKLGSDFYVGSERQKKFLQELDIIGRMLNPAASLLGNDKLRNAYNGGTPVVGYERIQ